MNTLAHCRLPRIIWIAARPPIPPFSGSTSKSLCGISALSAVTRVDVISFVERCKKTESSRLFDEFWKGRVQDVHWVAYGVRPNFFRAAVARGFQFGIQLENSTLQILLEELCWNSPELLLIFDDIVLAPFMKRFGQNAILSPHDCMSKMFWSHFRNAPFDLKAARCLLQSMLARRYEQTFYHQALLTHIVTQRDRVWLEAINPKARYEVAPNADLLNPGFSKLAANAWDVLVWGDMRISSISHGAKAFLIAAREQGWLSNKRVLVVGRAETQNAKNIIGADLMSLVTYAPCLEDGLGRIQHAKITVIPDAGGAGIKNRCVNMLSSGKCLACLYPQMEGIEKVCDRGAINAASLTELAARVKKALREETWPDYAQTGQAIYEREYGVIANRQLWVEMVERAVAIRAGKN